MASSAEDLPSCSKMDTVISTEETKVEDTIINKFPVVVLTKLDPDMISVNLNTVDMKQFEENQKSLSNKAMVKSEVKKSYWNDDDATLSDVSVSMSDGEEMETQAPKVLTSIKRNYRKSGKGNANEDSYKEKKKNTSKVSVASVDRGIKCETVSSKLKPDVQGKEIKKENLTGSVFNKHKASSEVTEAGDYSFKKPKAEETIEKITSSPLQEVKSTKDKKYNINARYKLTLGPFTESALANESFRKFINLASDCVVSFIKKKTTFGSMNGNVELFFGDFLTLQSAIQRLVQLSVLVDKLWVKGSITCLEIKPANRGENKDQRKADFSAKLFFQLCTEKREKLQQLISNKGRMKEGTKRKCVQLIRIPSSINEEMLSLLFPFSVGVKISDTGSSQKDFKGPVEIEFENQEWADAVLACFRDFGISTNRTYDKVINLEIKNFTPGKEKSQDTSSVSTTFGRRKQITSGIGRGTLNQRGRTLNQGRSLPIVRNLAPMSARIYGVSNQRTTDSRGLLQNRNDQRKRTLIGAGFGQRGLVNRDLAVKRIRLDNAVQARELARVERIQNETQSQRAAQAEASNDAIHKIAHAKGLDPSNPDIIRILEMQAHLEQLQTIALHQRAEVKSLGLMGVSSQQVVNEHQLQIQQQQQALAMKQAQEEAEVRRYQAAVQAQNLRARGFDGAEQAGNSWPQNDSVLQNLELARRREEENRMKQEEYLADIQRKEIIADRQKQLEEMHLLSRHGMQLQREGRRGAGRLGNAPGGYATAAEKIKPFKDAPATSGLLGPAPLTGPGGHATGERDKQHEDRNRHDQSGLSQRGRNMPRSTSSRQRSVSHDQASPSRAFSATNRLNSSQTNLAFRQRAQDNRKTQDTSERSRFPERRSRWNTDADVEDRHSVSLIQVEPDRNDRPLDFNRPMSRLTTEQAFKQDIERTRAVLSSQVDTARGRSLRPNPHLKSIRPLLEEVRDRHSLPVQFGKNAPKTLPKLNESERRNADNRFPTGIDRNARGNAFGESWDTGPYQKRGGDIVEEFEDKYRGSNIRASRGGLMPQRGRGTISRSSDLPSSGNVRSGQRNILAPEQTDAFEFDVQWRRNKAQPRSSGIASNRNHDLVSGQVWQEARESQGYDQREPENFYPEEEFDYGNNNLTEKGNGYRVDQEYNERPSQFFEEEEQFETARRTYGARDFQKFTRAEEEQVNYEEYAEPGDYTSETGFRNEDAFGGYQARNTLGARRGGRVLASRGGRGNAGEALLGRGALNVKRNVQQRGQGRVVAGSGRGLLDVPQEYKHIEAAYFGDGGDESHMEVAGEEFGQYQAQQLQSKGRNSRVAAHMPPPPLPPLLGQRGNRGVNFY